MIYSHRRSGIGFLVAAAALAIGAPARADTTDRSYVARYELETATGVVRASETLRVRREEATSFVSVASDNGALVSLPTDIAADGEIVANSFDPSVTCYNMAMAALYANEHAPAQPAAVYIRLGNDTIGVPVSYTVTQSADGDRTFVGKGAQALTIAMDSDRIAAGMVVDARIHLLDGALDAVAFDEATLIGSPAKTLSRMSCSLAKDDGQSPADSAPPATLPG
jgi:hypothetical protein